MNIEKLSFNREPAKILNGKKFFVSCDGYREMRTDLHTGFINKLKTFLKRFPHFYSFIFYFVAPAVFLGKGPKCIYDFLPEDSLILDIGSGNRRLHKKIVNVDVYPWSEIDIVADVHDLPFYDNSVDGIVFSWVLEHMKDPIKAVSELHRVLKKGGYLYLSTNFITPYHPSPKDYYRWTADGLKVLLKDFNVIELRPHVGPTCAFLSVFQEWVALALSFNIKILKDMLWIFWVIVTSPLKLLDLIFIHYSSVETITAGFYAIVKKR